MRISKKVFGVAVKYLDVDYIKTTQKFKKVEDLKTMGVDIKPWLDENTVNDVLIVVSRRILENGVNI